jgi:hypothetical protein
MRREVSNGFLFFLAVVSILSSCGIDNNVIIENFYIQPNIISETGEISESFSVAVILRGANAEKNIDSVRLYHDSRAVYWELPRVSNFLEANSSPHQILFAASRLADSGPVLPRGTYRLAVRLINGELLERLWLFQPSYNFKEGNFFPTDDKTPHIGYFLLYYKGKRFITASQAGRSWRALLKGETVYGYHFDAATGTGHIVYLSGEENL